ncbi:MAG: hypothetical protein ABS36_00015 [Acidobacteria bacterium SCN 69-37]|nr:MAG: hypothetical protein ABS36_00015 [Acidobacteria bacterium SCN 69-37]
MTKVFWPIAIVVVTLAATVVMRQWQVASQDNSTIAFQFVPLQRESPVAIRSWILARADLWRPRIEVQNQSEQPVSIVTPVVLISTPSSIERIDLTDVPIALDVGQTAELQLDIPDRWRDGPWQSYSTGAVVTLGIASVRFATGRLWSAPVAPDGTLVVSQDVEIRTPANGLIGRRPANIARTLMLTSSVSEYPLNSSLGDGTCVMSACQMGRWCEYDGCQILP